MTTPLPDYAELHCLSNFSFLHGASHPHELVEQAAALGYRALALTDECSLAGVVRAHIAAKSCGLKLIIGAEFHLQEGLQLVLLAPDRRAYAELSGLISRARLRSDKGQYQLNLADCQRGTRHCLAIWVPRYPALDDAPHGETLAALFPGRLWLGVQRLHRPQEALHYQHLHNLAQQCRVPMLACGGVLMHCRARKPLQDVLSAIRLGTPVAQLGTARQANAEHYLRPTPTLDKLYPPALLAETLTVAKRCHFSLDEISYQYPDESVPAGRSAADFLRELTEAGARQRWPNGVPESVVSLLQRELGLIRELDYEHYFLTVHDIVQFARNQGILCQGRGSAANSAVCYCLGITEVDPSRGQLLMERFISKERDEPPDIDVDFEHERREEVIQYIYRKYGRDRAALAATVICYRPRSAVREVAKALGFDASLVDQLSRSMAWWDKRDTLVERLREAGIGAASQTAHHFLQRVNEILGFPRHLSQHVGGFVISREPIANLVPLENAAMPERTLIQWDKEDLEALGLMKVDVLALGMLSAIRKSLAYISEYSGKPLSLQDIPAEDPATYAMLRQADSIGVFQVESRAQITMLPRLAPRKFYDLVIQIAIVRPGPIQGGMVHPYLRRRQGLEPVTYEGPDIEKVLERTLGIPIFQEQVIQLAMVAAGFSGGEADQLRRAMASWGRNGYLETFRDKLIAGMLQRGYTLEYAERLFSQMRGFGAYGFPESHSASFALLAYASAWLKRHHPAAFYCGLLNSQPMGFYSPAQLVQDAQRHGVEIRPLCVNHSDWQHSLETNEGQAPALRLGLRQIKGLAEHAVQALLSERLRGGFFTGMADFLNRLKLDERDRNALIRADAFQSFRLHRHQSQWEASAQQPQHPLLHEDAALDDGLILPAPTEAAEIAADYDHAGLSLRRHPLALLRERPRFNGLYQTAQLSSLRDGQFLRIAGLITCRQRPGTASGVLFLTLEDETGSCNVVVWRAVQERCRRAILGSHLVMVKGTLQHQPSPPHPTAPGETLPPVLHIVAFEVEDWSTEMALALQSHDFH